MRARQLIAQFIAACEGVATSNGVGGQGAAISTVLTPKVDP